MRPMNFCKYLSTSAAIAAAFLLYPGAAHALSPCQRTDRVYEMRTCLRIQQRYEKLSGYSLAQPIALTGATATPAKRGKPPSNYVSAGATLRNNGRIIVISRIRLHSPADVAGLMPGDEITAIDGQPIKSNASAESVTNMLNGTKDTSVDVEIGRRNMGLQTVTLVRSMQAVEDSVAEMQGRLAYVNIRYFSKDAVQRTREFLVAQAKARNPHGVILDLRGNPGGEQANVQALLGMLLPEGTTIAKLQTANAFTAVASIGKPVLPTDTPIVVLVTNDGPYAVSLVVAGLKTNTRNRVTVIQTADNYARTTSSDFLIPDTKGLRVFTPPQDALLMPGSDVRIYFDAEYVERVTEITLPASAPGTDTALEKARELLR